jgi:RNA 2',3'-cyclic 3'-phosphodiesterase
VEAMGRLAGEADRGLRDLGFPAETRPYRAHLTIGRVKSPRGLKELARNLEQLAEAPEEAAAWPVEEIRLVRSDLRPAGPEYTILERFALRGAGQS